MVDCLNDFDGTTAGRKADAATSAPRIVNGLTVRPRKRVNVWLWAVLLVPDVMALFVLVAIGTHRLLRHLESKWPAPNR